MMGKMRLNVRNLVSNNFSLCRSDAFCLFVLFHWNCHFIFIQVYCFLFLCLRWVKSSNRHRCRWDIQEEGGLTPRTRWE